MADINDIIMAKERDVEKDIFPENMGKFIQITHITRRACKDNTFYKENASSLIVRRF